MLEQGTTTVFSVELCEKGSSLKGLRHLYRFF